MKNYDKYIEFVRNVVPALNVMVSERYNTGYDVRENKLIIGPDIEASQAQFMRHLREVHKCEFVDALETPYWVLLHEIGHYMTYEKVKDKIDVITRQAIIDNAIDFELDECYDVYFGLLEEWEATEWAIRYVQENLI